MKRLIITEEEKQRILQMHESAIKKNYLMEADPINPPKQSTTKTSTTSLLPPEAETVKSYIDAENLLKNATIGVDLKPILNSYRSGVKEGFVKGKDQYYYWTVTDVNKGLQFDFKELSYTGQLYDEVIVSYMPSSKTWSWILTQERPDWNDELSQPGFNKYSWFWDQLVGTSKGLDITQLLRFLRLNLQMQKPSNFKEMVNSKSYVTKSENFGVDDARLNVIKSSDIYKSLT
jgi:hypothetical protein